MNQEREIDLHVASKADVMAWAKAFGKLDDRAMHTMEIVYSYSPHALVVMVLALFNETPES